MRDDIEMVEEEDPYLTISSHSTTLSSRIHTLEKPIHQLRELVTSWDVIDSSSSTNPDDNNNIQIILETNKMNKMK